jgi:hypothetical protein
MAQSVSNSSAFVAIKSPSVLGSAFRIKRLWKDHPHEAAIVQTAINGAIGAIAAHNYCIGSSPRSF